MSQIINSSTSIQEPGLQPGQRVTAEAMPGSFQTNFAVTTGRYAGDFKEEVLPALNADLKCLLGDALDQFAGVDPHLLASEAERALNQLLGDLRTRIGLDTFTSKDVFNALVNVELRDSETNELLGSLTSHLSEDNARHVAIVWSGRLLLKGSLTFEDSVSYAVAAINERRLENDAASSMETVAELEDADIAFSDQIRVCVLNDEGRELVTVEPYGVTLTPGGARKLSEGLLEAASRVEPLQPGERSADNRGGVSVTFSAEELQLVLRALGDHGLAQRELGRTAEGNRAYDLVIDLMSVSLPV